MEKRIELEKRGRRANQIAELNLDNCRSTNIVGLTDEFTALESLSLINVGLTTLKGFPKLPNLKKLELSDNRISNGLNYLTTSPKLSHLNLSGNKIKDLETLKPLEAFQNLEVLDLFNNEATNVENYREKIFGMFPSLKYLDGFDANEVEASSEGDDDDEVNGNESDDAKDENVFAINGIEIDLDELEKFEEKLKQKKGSNQNQVDTVNNSIDELDEYLEQLKIKENETESTDSVIKQDTSSMDISNPIEISTAIVAFSDNSTNTTNSNYDSKPTSFASLYYAIMAILHFASVIYKWGEEDDSEDTEEGSDEDERGDVSLSEVYNDDLEEDNSDWGEENDGEEMNDDEEDDEDDSDEGDEATPGAVAAPANNQKEAETPAEESQARGKKRKHDG